MALFSLFQRGFGTVRLVLCLFLLRLCLFAAISVTLMGSSGETKVEHNTVVAFVRRRERERGERGSKFVVSFFSFN